MIQNTSSLPNKTLTIVGQGDGASGTIIQPGTSPWQDRIFEVVATTGSNISVVFQDLAIAGGNATNGGILGGTAALGGGLLIDGGTVSMTRVAVQGRRGAGRRRRDRRGRRQGADRGRRRRRRGRPAAAASTWPVGR